MKNKIQAKFKELFGEGGQLFMSSGRINLIGEYTDYNGGYVFRAPLTMASWPKSSSTAQTR